MTFLQRLREQFSTTPANRDRQLERRINYRFGNRRLMERALTHRSVSDKPRENFERLEYLGDAVLSHVVSAHLFDRNPGDSEGELTMGRSALVNRYHLARVAEDLELPRFLRVSGGVRLGDPRVRRNMSGDALEALIGAIYLDGGIIAAERFIKRHFLGRRRTAEAVNYKGRLIEFCHQMNLGNPRFHLLRTHGPEHDKKFVVRVRVGSRTFESARANNKKAAEQEAAELALEALTRDVE